MQRRKLFWFAGVGIAAVLVQGVVSAWRGVSGGGGGGSAPGGGEGDATVTARSQGATQIVLARTDGPFLLDGGPVRVPMRAMPTRAGAKARSLAALLERVQQDEHVLLVLRGLHADQPPNIVVQVYLGLTEGETPAAQDDPHYAGTLNFSNVVRPPGAEGAQGPDQFDSFDVSDVIQNLRTSKKLTDPIHLTLQPVGKAAEGSKPSISRIDLVLQ
jgi:hypothetical protein